MSPRYPLVEFGGGDSLRQSHGTAVLSKFMEQLTAASSSMLLLDYDVTLAPFHTERHLAYPYPGVVAVLEKILDAARSRVIIVTGRPVLEIGPLLRPLNKLEIWGSHGLEHLMADGTYRQFPIGPEVATSLSQAESFLIAAGLSQRIEIKPGGIAVHWRGMPAVEMESVRTRTQRALSALVNQSGLRQLEFDEGLELRVEHPNKGDTVRSILRDLGDPTRVAFLGDDLTDEDAFRALHSRGLSVLVRPEYRETDAEIWLEPPGELIDFLEQWRDAVSA